MFSSLAFLFIQGPQGVKGLCGPQGLPVSLDKM